ncbi:hypothetical protein DFH07DRAFT_969183 [Mycena maculata]|uniref:BAG domain-containing protein n=1 Tax=Mycena maculata TaxID=230809 RepID=A0AAD7MRU7_9AGAR|nr:hypothetical protein DFH07DRAFT_969183 [Mycena maculata]
MFSYYPRPQSYYTPSPAYYQSSPYARAVAQQQQQQQRARALAQEMERQRAARSRYFPDGYDYEPETDEDDYYVNPRQRALIEAQRRQEALEQRKRDAARVFQERAMKQQQARAETTPPPRSPSRRSPSPSTTQPSASPLPQPSPSAPSSELLNEAATKIQTQYRIHRSLRNISELASKFETLKASFVHPTTIDYQGSDGSIISVPVPEAPSALPAESAKLAFTPTNVPLHTYMEFLSRLLVSLDAVESRGDRGVREQRRNVVRAIEGEAARVEAFWRGVWSAHEEKQHADAEGEEVSAMVVDEERLTPELAAPESDSDVEPELPTPFSTPMQSPRLPESESGEEDGVIVDVVPQDEKISGEDFVIV